MRQSEGWQKVKHGTGVGKGGSDATPHWVGRSSNDGDAPVTTWLPHSVAVY